MPCMVGPVTSHMVQSNPMTLSRVDWKPYARTMPGNRCPTTKADGDVQVEEAAHDLAARVRAGVAIQEDSADVTWPSAPGSAIQ